jgi:hypothetical protein
MLKTMIMYASSVINHDVESQSGQTKEYQFGIPCFSIEALNIKDDVSEWGEMSTRGMVS